MVPMMRILRLIPAYENIKNSEDYPWLKPILTRITITFWVTALAMSVPGLGSFINISGSLFGVFIVFILPIGFYFKSQWHQIPVQTRYMCCAILFYAIFGGVFSIIQSIRGFFE